MNFPSHGSYFSPAFTQFLAQEHPYFRKDKIQDLCSMWNTFIPWECKALQMFCLVLAWNMAKFSYRKGLDGKLGQ